MEAPPDPFESLLSSLASPATVLVDSTPSCDGRAFCLHHASDALRRGKRVVYVSCTPVAQSHQLSCLRKLGAPPEALSLDAGGRYRHICVSASAPAPPLHAVGSAGSTAGLPSQPAPQSASADPAAAAIAGRRVFTEVPLEALLASIASASADLMDVDGSSAQPAHAAAGQPSALLQLSTSLPDAVQMRRSSCVALIVEDAGLLCALSSSNAAGLALCRSLVQLGRLGESSSSGKAVAAATAAAPASAIGDAPYSATTYSVLLRLCGVGDLACEGPLSPPEPLERREGDSPFTTLSLVRYIASLADVHARLLSLTTGFSRGIHGRIEVAYKPRARPKPHASAAGPGAFESESFMWAPLPQQRSSLYRLTEASVRGVGDVTDS